MKDLEVEGVRACLKLLYGVTEEEQRKGDKQLYYGRIQFQGL